jgi:hypothetical protein
MTTKRKTNQNHLPRVGNLLAVSLSVRTRKSYGPLKKHETRGHIADAARLLGYTPGTLRKKICETPELRQAKEEIVETRLDDAERKLQQHIYEKDNVQALLEYLKAVGRRRGYGNAPIDVNLNGKVEHSLDSEIAQGLVDKFQKMLDEDAENEQQS